MDVGMDVDMDVIVFMLDMQICRLAYYVFKHTVCIIWYPCQNGHCGMHVRCSLPSLQWMTAGRGIVHSEMPGGDGNNIGLQLWINLKGKDKVK